MLSVDDHLDFHATNGSVSPVGCTQMLKIWLKIKQLCDLLLIKQLLPTRKHKLKVYSFFFNFAGMLFNSIKNFFVASFVCFNFSSNISPENLLN